MPYIPRGRREAIRRGETPKNVGELTFQVTEVIRCYLEEFGASFARFGESIAALEATKLELYRRQTAPYEDLKIQENGDVW